MRVELSGKFGRRLGRWEPITTLGSALSETSAGSAFERRLRVLRSGFFPVYGTRLFGGGGAVWTGKFNAEVAEVSEAAQDESHERGALGGCGLFRSCGRERSGTSASSKTIIRP